jgi:SET domain-containing protein
MLLFKNCVAPSSIEGVGVFTAERILQGDVIWRSDRRLDVLISIAELESLPASVREFVLRYGYPSNSDDSAIVIESDNGRFMNHSVEANTDFSTPSIGIAKRNIEAGEEVTCNYGEFYDRFELMPPVKK